MATTTITAASFQLACAECADAINDEDWTTAAKKYAVAEAISSGLALEAEADDARMKRRENLSGLRTAIEVAQVAVGRTADRGRFISTRVGYRS